MRTGTIPRRLRALLRRQQGFTLAELIISIALLGMVLLVMLQSMLVMKRSVGTETNQIVSRTRITRAIAFLEQTIRRNESVGGLKLYNGTTQLTTSDQTGNCLVLKILEPQGGKQTYLHYKLNSMELVPGSGVTVEYLIAFVSDKETPEADDKDAAWVAANAMILYRGVKSFTVSIGAREAGTTLTDINSGVRLLQIDYELYHPNGGTNTRSDTRNISLWL